MSYNTYPQNPFPPNSENAGGGTSYTLPIASANTLGGVKVGDNLTINANGVLSAPTPYEEVFSTTPVKIGKWLNKDLYRVVVDTGTLTNNTDKAIPSGLTNENVVRMCGFAKDNNGVTLAIPYSDGVAFLCPYYDPTTHTINYVIKSNLSGYTSSYCVLEYTVEESEG